MAHYVTAPAANEPITAAIREIVASARDVSLIDDLLFLERWEMAPQPGVAHALRMSQIRRANPKLAEAVRAELNGWR